MSEPEPQLTVEQGRMEEALRQLYDMMSKDPAFSAGKSIIRGNEGDVEAVACLATGQRAQWLLKIFELLDESIELAQQEKILRREDAINRAMKGRQS